MFPSPTRHRRRLTDLNRIPIKTIGGTTIYIKDVAWVRDGFPPQTNIVKVNGQRSVLLTIQKAGDASTLNVISGIKALLPQIQDNGSTPVADKPSGGSVDFCPWRDQRSGQGDADCRMPDGFHDSHFPGQLAKHADHRDVHPSGDPDLHHRVQRDRRNDQHHDARRTRSGGRHPGGRCHGRGREHQSKSQLPNQIRIWTKSSWTARRKSRHLPSSPRFRSASCLLRCSCCQAWREYLFVPLAEAVVFAMLASYLLSRTIVPTMAKYLLRGDNNETNGSASRNPLVRLQKRFEAAFERFREALSRAAGELPPSPPGFPDCILRGLSGLSGNSDSLARPGLLPQRGQRHFQTSSSRSYGNAHRRNCQSLRSGGAVDSTADSGGRSPNVIDNIGLPYSGINLSYSNSAPVGTSDADILVTLSANHHPTDRLRSPTSSDICPNSFRE